MSNNPRSPLSLGQVRAARAAATAALRYLPSFAQAPRSPWTQQVLYACQKPARSPGRTVAASYAAAVRRSPSLTAPAAPFPALQPCTDLLEHLISHSLSILRILKGLPAGLLLTMPQSPVPFPHPVASPPSPTAPRHECTPTPHSTPTPSPPSPVPPTHSCDASEPSPQQPVSVGQQLKDVWAAIAELRHSGKQIRELVEEHQQQWACELPVVEKLLTMNEQQQKRMLEQLGALEKQSASTGAVSEALARQRTEAEQQLARMPELVDRVNLLLGDVVSRDDMQAELRKRDEAIASCHATVELCLAELAKGGSSSTPSSKSAASKGKR